MRISDWSSDVCSSDLFAAPRQAHIVERLVVDAEEAAGRAIFGRHIGERRAVGEAEAVEAGAVIFDEAPDDALGAQHLRRGEHEVGRGHARSEEHTSELQSLMRISYAVFCLKTKKKEKLYAYS